MERLQPWSDFLRSFDEASREAGLSSGTLGETTQGPVRVWFRDTGESVPLAYLSAGIHGDEPAGPLALLQLMREGFFHSTNHRINWILCPALNPSGLANNARENSAGIDLNRDYRIRSSPETIAHAAFLEQLPQAPDLFISLHEDWESHGFYFYEINHGHASPERTSALLAAVSPWFSPEPSALIDDHEVRSPGWIFHPPEADEPEGWPEAIFLSHLGCPLSFTFETPSRAPLESRVAAHVAAVKAACAFPTNFHPSCPHAPSPP